MARVLLVNLASLPMPGNEPIFPIGARCVQEALSRAGHTVVLLDFVEMPAGFQDLSWASRGWDIIGFAIRNIDPIDLSADGHVQQYVHFVNQVREAAVGSPLWVGGGPGFSLFADELVALLALDVGVRGPGEARMLEIAANPERYRGAGVLEGGRYEGFLSEVMVHPPGLMQAYADDRHAMIGVETRRKTCFQRCVYCPYAYITGQNAGDSKPIDVLRSEISAIYDAGFRRIFFTDGIFNSGITYAKSVVAMLGDGHWPEMSWAAYFAAQPFDDEFASLLVRSSVEPIVVSPDSLDNDLMARLGKNFDLEAMNRFVATCRRHGLRLMVNIVFGAPGETRGTVANTARYINTMLSPEEVSLHIGYRILPNTSLAKDVGLGPSELLEPTFYPFDPALFNWVMSDLNPEFLTPPRLLNLLAGRAAVRRMAEIILPESRVLNEAIERVVAIRKVPRVGSSI